MEFTLEDNIKFAREKCEYDYDNSYLFDQLYLITTENIGGYVEAFDLKDKSLMTVGSSGDQALNAVVCGCKDVTVMDINRFTKYYYYLKLAGILSLSKQELSSFICEGKNNPNYFKEKYKIVKEELKKLDKESYIFWDTLFDFYPTEEVLRNLFFNIEVDPIKYQQVNLYMKQYDDIKDKLISVQPKFKYCDLTQNEIEGKFDNIWLSNILARLMFRNDIFPIIDKSKDALTMDGKLLVCYMYNLKGKIKYSPTWNRIYFLNDILKDMDEFESYSFPAIEKLRKKGQKDFVYTYKKSK